MGFSVLTGLLFLIDDCKGKSHTVARILMQSQPVSPRFVKPELWFTYNSDGVCFLRRVSVAVMLMWWYSCKRGCTFLSDIPFVPWNMGTVLFYKGTIPMRDVFIPRWQGSWGQNGAHLGPVSPRWAPFWPHEPCYQGLHSSGLIYWGNHNMGGYS